jgi:hypothetical protein
LRIKKIKRRRIHVISGGEAQTCWWGGPSLRDPHALGSASAGVASGERLSLGMIVEMEEEACAVCVVSVEGGLALRT